MRESYFLKVALGLVDGADEHGSGLYELFVVFGGHVLTDKDAIGVRQHDALEAVKFLCHPFEELGAFPSHKYYH